jgi:hypothetical protein
MKKILLAIIVIVLPLFNMAYSQDTLVIHLKGGSVVTYPLTNIDSITFKVPHDTTANDTAGTTSLIQLSKDDAQVQASDDEIMNDANTILTSTNSAKSMDTIINSNLTITVDSINHGDTIVYTMIYNGFNTGHNFSRTGTVLIEKLKGVHWSTVGCAVTYQYINLAVTKVTDGKTFIFNGTRTWTNVSGGLIKDLGNGSVTSIVHNITGALQITFDNGVTRTWSIARQRTWNGTFPSSLTVTASGFGSAAGYNNLVEYGTDRNGEAFYGQINTPILYSYNICIPYAWLPIWGVIVYQIPSVPKSGTVTFGYNSSDVLVTEGTCADYYKLDWVVKIKNGTIYLMIP